MGDVRPGDWMCPSCGTNVFASKLTCFKCGAAKPNASHAYGMQNHAVHQSMGAGMPGAYPALQAGEINPRLAKQQAEMHARMRAQAEQQGETNASSVPGGDSSDRKRMMEEIHSSATATGKRRKRRWGAETEKVAVQAVIPSGLNETQQRAFTLHVQIEEINTRLRRPDLGIPADPRARSPSPEPIYSQDGKRLNTREYRTKKKLEGQRHDLIEEYKKLNPSYQPPKDYRPPEKKISDKVMIPQDEHPHIGFMGLLIGPRGNTLKKIQKETGCKVMIRGKGTEKEGKGRSSRTPQQGDGEQMHAIVEAPSEGALKKCVEKIRKIIAVGIECPDGHNELKRMQLRELAALNGTLREDEMVAKCKNCGSFDHRTWQCPHETNFVNQMTCTRCGGRGHVAADCRVTLSDADGGAPPPGRSREEMDSEYAALMSELGESSSRNAPPPPSGPPPPKASDSRAPPPWAAGGSRGPSQSSSSSAPPPWASKGSGAPPPGPPSHPYGAPQGYGGGPPPWQQQRPSGGPPPWQQHAPEGQPPLPPGPPPSGH